MKIIINGCTINYFTIGEGVPVLMLHGYELDHVVMKAACEPIFEEITGFKRIYFDLPGMGYSTPYETLDSSDKMLEVVMTFIDNLIEGRPFLMMGQSYGGYLARGILKHRPAQVMGMFLIAPAVQMAMENRKLPEHRILYKDQNFLKTLEKSVRTLFEDNFVILSQDIYKRFEHEVFRAFLLADDNFVSTLQDHAYGFDGDINDDLAVYDIPVVILTGRQDVNVGYEDAYGILNQLPRASFAIIDGAGHYLQIEQARLFASYVKEWLRKIPR